MSRSRGAPRKYDFSDMQINERIVIVTDRMGSIRATVSKFSAETGRKFTVRKDNGQLTVTRTA